MPKIDYCMREIFGGPCGRRKGHGGNCATIAAHHLDKQEAMEKAEADLLMEIQADIQVALGMLRMEISPILRGQRNLKYSEDRMVKAEARCHKRLHELGVDMFHPAIHPEVWDGPSTEALEARGHSSEVIAASSSPAERDSDGGLEDSGPSRDVPDPPQDR